MTQTFHRPRTVNDAIARFDQLEHRGGFLAGGTALNAADGPGRPEHLISLDALGLDGFAVRDGALHIGACCTLQQIIDGPDVVPSALHRACGHLTNRNVRVVATLGGHIAERRTYAAAVPALVALEAEVEIARWGGEPLTLPVLDYVVNDRRELITGIRIPLGARCRRVGLAKYVRCANDRATVNAAASVSATAGNPIMPILVVGGVAERVLRLDTVERAVDGAELDRDALEALVRDAVSPTTDLRGSAAFKRHLTGVLIAEALIEARAEAGS